MSWVNVMGTVLSFLSPCCILYFKEEFEKMREAGMTTENVLG